MPGPRLACPRKRRRPPGTPKRSLGVRDLECRGRRRRPLRSCVQHRQHRPGRRGGASPARYDKVEEHSDGLYDPEAARRVPGAESAAAGRGANVKCGAAAADQGRDHPLARSPAADVRPHVEDPAAGARRRGQPRRHPRGRRSARDREAHGAVPRRRLLLGVRGVRRGGTGARPAPGAQALDHLGGHRPGRGHAGRSARHPQPAQEEAGGRRRRRPTSTARSALPADSSPGWRSPPPTSPPSSPTWWRSRTWRSTARGRPRPGRPWRCSS